MHVPIRRESIVDLCRSHLVLGASTATCRKMNANYSTIYYYRPQTKFAKVMFLRLSVGHSVHRGGMPQCMMG